MLALLRPLDKTLDNKKALKLDVTCNTMYETMAVLILTTSLLLIYNHRKENKGKSVREVRAELEPLCGLLGWARAIQLRQTAAMVRNQNSNFM